MGGGVRMTYMNEMAQLLDLWPDPRRITSIEDQVSLHLFATDRSYKAEPETTKDILTAESIIGDKGKGAGRIVLLPRNKRTPIQITRDAPEPSILSFGLLISDCTSALTRFNMALHSFNN
jgi:hypothetical protein